MLWWCERKATTKAAADPSTSLAAARPSLLVNGLDLQRFAAPRTGREGFLVQLSPGFTRGYSRSLPPGGKASLLVNYSPSGNLTSRRQSGHPRAKLEATSQRGGWSWEKRQAHGGGERRELEKAIDIPG